MPKAKLPPDEDARLEAVRQLEILDTESEATFDQLTLLAAQLCEAPYAALTLIDSNRQWFKSKFGSEVSGMPPDVAFCTHMILEDHPLIVPDATLDERFADNPAVLALRGVRFYAGTACSRDRQSASRGWGDPLVWTPRNTTCPDPAGSPTPALCGI